MTTYGLNRSIRFCEQFVSKFKGAFFKLALLALLALQPRESGSNHTKPMSFLTSFALLIIVFTNGMKHQHLQDFESKHKFHFDLLITLDLSNGINFQPVGQLSLKDIQGAWSYGAGTGRRLGSEACKHFTRWKLSPHSRMSSLRMEVRSTMGSPKVCSSF